MQLILQKALEALSQGNSSSGYDIIKLAGDASLRKYYRVSNGTGCFVLLQADPFEAGKYDFLLVQKYIESRKIPVPRVLAVEEAHGAILLEDLGDRTMLHELGDHPDREEELFKASLDLLFSFHQNTIAKGADKPVPGFALAFDEEKLMWEVDFTLEHLFGSYLKRNIPTKEFQEVRETFVHICKRLAAEPRVFTHRDYHSRNLMLDEKGRMVCIDFQDARMGLRAYDLASILRDSYYQLSEERVYDLLDYYFQKASKVDSIEKSHFIKIFDLMSIQRNFKAIGSFTSFYGKRDDAMYIRFVGNTFENIRKNLGKFSEYKNAMKLLFRYYYF